MLKNHAYVRMINLYGVEHLLRFFVKLPELTLGLEMEEETMYYLNILANELLEFIHKNMSALFVNEYDAATAAYIRQASN